MFLLQGLFHFAFHTLHKGDFLIKLGLESVNLVVLLLLVVILARNAIKLWVHLALIAVAGVFAEEGLISGKTHQIKL